MVEIDRVTMPVVRSDSFRQTSFEEKMRAPSTSAYATAACAQGKRTQHGKPQGVDSDRQPDARICGLKPLAMTDNFE